MKKLWKYLAVVLILCMVSGCSNGLTGGETGNQLTETGAENLSADQEKVGSEKDECGAGAGEEQTNDIDVWGMITAGSYTVLGVPAEDGQGTYPTYQVEIGQLSGELVKDVLLRGRNISIKEVDADSWYTDQTQEYYLCQDGTYLKNGIGQLLFVAVEAEYWPTPDVFLQPDFLKLVFPDGQDLVLAQTDWDYGTMRQAKQLVAGCLDELGVEYGSEWIAFGVSGNKMTAAMHDAYPDSKYPEDLVEGISRLGKPTWKKTYSGGDDVYIFRIPLALKGHLLTTAESIESKQQSQAREEGCFAYAMVGREGLRYLEILQLYTVTGESEAMKLITQEQAIQAAKDYIAAEDAALDPAIKTTWTREVTEVKFSYVPAIEKDGSIKGEVFPCWEVRCALYYGDETESSITVSYNVDAVTGQVRNTSQGFRLK